MRALLLSLALYTYSMAFSESVYSFAAPFEQRITDDQNKTIVYQGHVWAARPDKALWRYSDPIEKDVYIKGHRVIIIEPDLEQAIIKKIDNDIDLFALIAEARHIDDQTYEAKYADQLFTIRLKEGVLAQIEYLDPFENEVVLTFTDQVQNKVIDDKRFSITIPNTYDIIKSHR